MVSPPPRMVDLTKHPSLDTGASVRVADLLLERGLRVDEPAFVLEDWHATPLWHAISRGHNLVLAAHLLQRECDPDHCLWAAAYGDDVDAIRLLLEHGAELDLKSEPVFRLWWFLVRWPVPLAVALIFVMGIGG